MPEDDPDSPDRLLPRKQAARYLTDLGLETAPQTLARKFHQGTGPLCTHVGERAMYRQVHLDEYFASQVSAPRRSSREPRRPVAEADGQPAPAPRSRPRSPAREGCDVIPRTGG
jgi:hypothetical protein